MIQNPASNRVYAFQCLEIRVAQLLENWLDADLKELQKLTDKFSHVFMSSALGKFAHEAIHALARFIKGATYIKNLINTCCGFPNFLTYPDDLFNTLAAEIELQINLLWDGYIPAKKLIREGIAKLDQEAQS